MGHTFEIIRGTLLLLCGLLIFGAFAWWRFRESTDRGALLVRWSVTAGLLAYGLLYAGPGIRAGMNAGSPAALFGFFKMLLIAVVLVVMWVPEVVGSVGETVGSLFTGGNKPVEPKPHYSIAVALRTRGNYMGALNEVRRQLELFPRDMEGQMMLAAIQSENLDDLPGAQVTIERFIAQGGHAPANQAYALNLLADWHLKARDRAAAQAAFEKIIALLPETEMANQAAQRIGRLADTAQLLAGDDRRPIVLPKGVQNLGLVADSRRYAPVETSPAEQAAQYVRHLTEHPGDGHVRERLAILYATHFQRLDLAEDQLEQLIRQPHQTGKQIVHWLNLLADLQIRHGAPIETAHATLQRIVDQYPEVGATDLTRRRIDTLKLEYRVNQVSEDVHLGTYEQDIGLKPKS